MLRPAADHRVHQDYISDHLELTGERKEEEDWITWTTYQDQWPPWLPGQPRSCLFGMSAHALQLCPGEKKIDKEF